jgi:imidazolonepropionase-like amidohydrolase
MKSILLQWLMVAALPATMTVHAESLLITHGSVHIGDESAATVQDIYIEDGLIEAVSTDLSALTADRIIDAGGRPVTPALFAGITALGLSEIGMVYEAVDSRLNELYTGLMHPEFDVRAAYNPHSSAVPVTRVEGYGYTLLVAAPGDRTLSGQGSLVRFDGGFDSFEGDSALFVNVDGYSGNRIGGSRAAHWMLLNSAFAELSVADDDLTLISARGKAALKSARRDGIFVFRANRASDILQTLAFVNKHKLRAVISGAQEAWLVRKALADTGVPVIINALDNLPGSFDALGARLDNAALLNEAGVTVLFTSGETHNARKLRQVAGSAVANGLPYGAAIAAMTSLPAEVFGGQPRMIAPGLTADLVIWSGDPLDVNAAADLVIIDGRLDSMKSRQTQLLERYLPSEIGLGRSYISP